MRNKTGVIDFSILLYNLLCFIYLIILGFYSRPTIDDFEYIAANHDSLSESIAYFYNHVNGRVLPNLVTSLIFLVYKSIDNLIFVTVLMIVGYYWILNKIVCSVWDRYFVTRPQPLQKFNLLTFFITTFIIYNFEMNTFTWTIACIIYFGSILAALVLGYCVFTEKRSFLDTAAIICTSLFIGCSNESFSLIINTFLLAFLVFKFIHGDHFSRSTHMQKSVLALLLISCSILIMYFAPANESRLAGLQTITTQKLPLSIEELIPASINAFVLFSKFLILKIPLLALSVCIFMYIINSVPKKIKLSIPPFSIVIFIIIFWLSILPTTYLIVYTPLRVLTPVWFYIIALTLLVASGLRVKSGLFALVSISILIAGILYKIYTEVPVIQKYTFAYDTRTEKLIKHNSATFSANQFIDSLPLISFYRFEGIALNKARNYVHLPVLLSYLNQPAYDNPFVYSPYRDAEISSDADDWKNIQLQRALKLKYKVAVKQ